jgi:hypothetical protein
VDDEGAEPWKIDHGDHREQVHSEVKVGVTMHTQSLSFRLQRIALMALFSTSIFLATAPATNATSSVYSNITAFAGSCDGTYDTYSSQLYNLTISGFRKLGYSPSGYTGTSFTKSKVLDSVDTDKAFYVHSHGDYYGSNDTQGFRVDAGYCSGAPIVYSTDVDSHRGSTPAQVVILSTCYLGENPPSGTNQLSMAEAFGIPQVQDLVTEWAWYMGYKKEPYTSDELEFESYFWNKIQGYAYYGLTNAFQAARAHISFSTPPGMSTPSPMWYGNPNYTGWYDTSGGCPNCE